ncbi:nitronate monooxygenase [Actinoplanes sp. NPDC051494]|uniref:nitronate monooxygenase n=1 Tax=Actinoplanes sp. NPDC051494 TaxID=3363907 RepID=UPI0037A0A9F1
MLPPGSQVPLISAPMAGGAGGVRLATAVGRAGATGFLAGGYKSADALAAEIAEMHHASVPFGVNLFAPRPTPIGADDFARYTSRIAGDLEHHGAVPDGGPVEDDDGWAAKIEVLCAMPVPVVSFTFGLPDRDGLDRLRRSGARLWQSVTTVGEARAAAEAGMDALVVQAGAAGGHSAAFDPWRAPSAVALPELVAGIRHATDLPIAAAGGVADAADVVAAVRAGADAVVVGTALLRSPEAGTGAVHRAALADPGRHDTVLTRAFTGRPARALVNAFTRRHSGYAPVGYPAVHHLTRAMRAAAAAAGDVDRVHLWAGTGFRHATDDPAAEIITRLAARL